MTKPTWALCLIIAVCLLALPACGGDAELPPLQPKLKAVLERSELIQRDDVWEHLWLYVPLDDLKKITPDEAGELLNYVAARKGIAEDANLRKVELRCKKTGGWIFASILLKRGKKPDIETYMLESNRKEALKRLGQ